MMPLAPTPIVPVPSKPKIGFSIDSIVGGNAGGGVHQVHHRLEIDDLDANQTSIEGASSPTALRANNRVQQNSPHSDGNGSDRPPSNSSIESYPRHRPAHPTRHNRQQHYLNTTGSTNAQHSGGSTPNHSPSPPHRLHHPDSPLGGGGPQPPPGVVRPNPNYPQPPPGNATVAAVAEQLKTLYGIPGHPQQSNAQNEYHAPHLALAANLAAAQHLQAANLAAALQAHHGAPPPPHHPGYLHPGNAGGPHPPPPHPHQPRESYPLYPWLLSRHGRIFPHRFPGGGCCYFLLDFFFLEY